MADEPYNAADAQKVREKGLDEKAYRKRLKEDLNKILQSPEGLRYIWYILTECHMFSSTYSTSHAEASFKEGQRALGLKLWAEAEAANPSAILTMLSSRLSHGNQP